MNVNVVTLDDKLTNLRTSRLSWKENHAPSVNAIRSGESALQQRVTGEGAHLFCSCRQVSREFAYRRNFSCEYRPEQLLRLVM